MIPVRTVDEVFAAIQRVKAAAPAFCTNFFPVQKKLQGWIEHGELMSEICDGAAFFFKQDRDLQHFYFCGASVTALQREIANLPILKTERIVADLVGSETVLGDVIRCLETAGFRRYSHLQRMARASQASPEVADQAEAPVVVAEATDRQAILDLLDSSFDRYADQLPMPYEIDAAIAAGQVFAVKYEQELAAM